MWGGGALPLRPVPGSPTLGSPWQGHKKYQSLGRPKWILIQRVWCSGAWGISLLESPPDKVAPCDTFHLLPCADWGRRIQIILVATGSWRPTGDCPKDPEAFRVEDDEIVDQSVTSQSRVTSEAPTSSRAWVTPLPHAPLAQFAGRQRTAGVHGALC